MEGSGSGIVQIIKQIRTLEAQKLTVPTDPEHCSYGYDELFLLYPQRAATPLDGGGVGPVLPCLLGPRSSASGDVEHCHLVALQFSGFFCLARRALERKLFASVELDWRKWPKKCINLFCTMRVV